MTHSSAAAPPMKFLRALAAWTLPWLCSTTIHMLLILVLAVTYTWTRGGVPHGSNLLSALEVGFIASPPEASEIAGTVELASSTSGYYEDEPAPAYEGQAEPAARPLAQPREAGDAGTSRALGELLDEEPPVNLAGVLPSSGDPAGSGAVEQGGAGSAHGLTSEPHGSNRARGGMARTGVFGAIGEGHKFVYVFDRSGSMDGHGGAPLSAAKAELISSLRNLGQTHQFQIIFYNEKPRVFNPSGVVGRLVFGTEQNKHLAHKFIGSITADGATRHEEALVLALRMAPDVIFFLTDADEPRLSAQQLAHIARVNQGTSINAIEFGYGPLRDSDNFLVTLARQNGGKHVYIDVSQLPQPRR